MTLSALRELGECVDPAAAVGEPVSAGFARFERRELFSPLCAQSFGGLVIRTLLSQFPERRPPPLGVL